MPIKECLKTPTFYLAQVERQVLLFQSFFTFDQLTPKSLSREVMGSSTAHSIASSCGRSVSDMGFQSHRLVVTTYSWMGIRTIRGIRPDVGHDVVANGGRLLLAWEGSSLHDVDQVKLPRTVPHYHSTTAHAKFLLGLKSNNHQPAY